MDGQLSKEEYDQNDDVSHISIFSFSLSTHFYILYKIIKPSHLKGGYVRLCCVIKPRGILQRKKGGSLRNSVQRSYTIPLYQFSVVYVNLQQNC